MLDDALYLAMIAKSNAGDITIETLNVSADGTYNAGVGKAYNPVIVNVEDGVYAELLTKNWGN